MSGLLRPLVLFIRRDWLIYSSYRLSFVLRVGSILFALAPFFFIGKMVQTDTLIPYGGSYFVFVVIGMAFSRYVGTSLSGLGGAWREDQLQGTLASMLVTGVPLRTLVMGTLAWEYGIATVEVAVTLLIGWLVFGISLAHVNLLSTFCVLALTLSALSSLGLLSACGILLFREADPVNWVLGGLMKLLGGVFFPVALLPGWLQFAAQWFPLTHALEGLRRAMLQGASLPELLPSCLALICFSLVLWPLAVIALQATLKRLKHTGALSLR